MDCIFCKIVNGDIPSYTIYENDKIKCFLDVNPISNGHTLIIPKKHFTDINDIDIDYLKEINSASKKIVTLINEKIKPDGIRLVQNNGFIQEVKHYHLHIIPVFKKEKEKKSVEDIFNLLTK